MTGLTGGLAVAAAVGWLLAVLLAAMVRRRGSQLGKLGRRCALLSRQVVRMRRDVAAFGELLSGCPPALPRPADTTPACGPVDVATRVRLATVLDPSKDLL